MLDLRRPGVAIVIAALGVAGGCSSSKHAAATTTSTTVPVGTSSGTPHVARGHFDIRAVQYSGSNTLIFPVSRKRAPATTVAGAFPGCATEIAQSPRDADSAQEVVLADRTRQFCYFLGPVLVTGADVDSARVSYDQTISQWAVNIHFANNHFLTRIATPYVGRQIAIVLDGVVQSAPTIEQGITGRDVEMTGNFSRTQAIAAAASILGVPRSAVRAQAAG